jgi:hypothetical protein
VPLNCGFSHRRSLGDDFDTPSALSALPVAQSSLRASSREPRCDSAALPKSVHTANRSSKLGSLRRLCADGQARQALRKCHELLRADLANPKLILLQQARPKTRCAALAPLGASYLATSHQSAPHFCPAYFAGVVQRDA